MKKKAVSKAVSILITLIIASFIVLVVIPWVYKQFASSERTIGGINLDLKINMCREQGKLLLAKIPPETFDDADKDGFPDSCDFCLGGNDNEDSDGDKIPTLCDTAGQLKATDTLKSICIAAQCPNEKDCWIKDSEQCNACLHKSELCKK